MPQIRTRRQPVTCLLVRHGIANHDGQRRTNARRGRYFPQPQLRPDVAEEFRIGPQRRHMTSPLESLENSASSVSTFSSTPQTGAPTFTASRTNDASYDTVPGITISSYKL